MGQHSTPGIDCWENSHHGCWSTTVEKCRSPERLILNMWQRICKQAISSVHRTEAGCVPLLELDDGAIGVAQQVVSVRTHPLRLACDGRCRARLAKANLRLITDNHRSSCANSSNQQQTPKRHLDKLNLA